MLTPPRIHRTAEVSPTAIVGDGTQIWNEAQIRDGARIGSQCMVGKAVYVDVEVTVGDRVKLETRVSVFKGARIANGAFIGPHACLLNDKRPRAITPSGAFKGPGDWVVSGVTVEEGASIGGAALSCPESESVSTRWSVPGQSSRATCRLTALFLEIPQDWSGTSANVARV